MEQVLLGNTELVLKVGDITEERVDAIVNAANEYLQHGGGVAGAIVRKGGYVIQEESNRIKTPLKVSDAVYTSAGKLPARYVIHTVGPRQGEGQEKEKIYRAVQNCLKLADEDLGCTSIAFPAISSGIFGVPKHISAEAIISAIVDYIEETPKTNLKRVVIVLFSERDYEAFKKYFPVII